MIDGSFAVAFTAGMLATVNPCGFAMLPAYLAFFLGTEGGGDDARAGLSRALAVGLCVSAGFAGTFAVIGLALSHLLDDADVYERAPWLSIVIGLLLVVLGVALLSGRDLKVSLPRLDVGGRGTGVGQMVGYGVSYAVVSLGCTMPLFLPLVERSFRRDGGVSGVLVFLVYGAGFTVLLLALSVAVALARTSLVTALRRVLPHVQRLSGLLLVLAGAYVAWYGWYEHDRLGESDTFVDRVTGWSADIQAWVAERGGTTVGLVLAVVVAVAAVFVAANRSRAR